MVSLSMQEMIVQVSGGRPHNQMLASVECTLINGKHVLLPFFLLMKQATRGCVGELEDTRRENLWHFEDLIIGITTTLIKVMCVGYQSLTVVIHVNTFGLLLVDMARNILMHGIVPVQPIYPTILYHLLGVITTVNQLLGMQALLYAAHISLMTHCGMGQDV